MFEPKYNMTSEENIFIAKRNIVDYIWKSAKLAGINVTFPETKVIYEGINVKRLTVDDIVAINNLKHAWQFSFDHVKYPTDLSFICKLNQIIRGTTQKPNMPIESVIKEEVAEIKNVFNPTERAIRLMLYCMRKQIFMKGMIKMNGNTYKKTKGVLSDCSKCWRNNKRHGVEHCECYDILSPHRKKCARYMGPQLNSAGGNDVKKRKSKKKKIKDSQKKVGYTTFPWEYK